MPVKFDSSTLQVLLRLRIFEGLDEATLGKLMKSADLVEVAPNEVLIQEGEQGNEVFVLLAGQVRITKRAGSIQKVIQRLKGGDCFGEMSLIDCRSRSASAKAETPCKLLRLDGEHLISSPAVSARIYRNIAILVSQKLRNANDLLTLG